MSIRSYFYLLKIGRDGLDFIENHNLSLQRNLTKDLNVSKQTLIMYKRVGQYDYARALQMPIQQQWQNLSYIHPDIQDMDFQ